MVVAYERCEVDLRDGQNRTKFNDCKICSFISVGKTDIKPFLPFARRNPYMLRNPLVRFVLNESVFYCNFL